VRKLWYVLRKLIDGGYDRPQHKPGTDPNCPFCQEMKRTKESR
jgi:hypothetical protein